MPGTDDSASAASSPPSEPKALLRIINADATPEEVAAIVAVFSALGGGEAPRRTPRPEWGSPNRQVRRPLSHGVGGWRSSTLPH